MQDQPLAYARGTVPIFNRSRSGHIFYRRHQPLGSDRNVSHESARGVEDRRGDRRSGSVHRQFAYALSAERSVRVFLLDYDRLHLRRVERRRDDVICQAVVHDAPTLPNQFLEQSVADRLQRSALDLPGGQHWMDGAADVLRGRNLERRHFVSIHIDFDFGDLGAVREDRISVAGVSVVVPHDAGRIGVTRKGAQFAAQIDVLADCLAKTRKPLPACYEPAVNQVHTGLAKTFGDEPKQFLFRFARRKLNDSTDDHASSRSHRRAAVGHARCVRLFNLDVVITDAQFLRHDLTKDRASPLTDFRRACENARAPFRRDLYAGLSLHLRFAAAGEAGAVKEERKADAPPLRSVVVLRDRSPLLDVAGTFDSRGQYVFRAYAPVQSLTRRSDIAFLQHVDAAKFERIDAEFRRDLFHLHFVSECDLGRAESAERPVGRSVRSDGASGDADIVASIWPRRVNRPARKHHRRERSVSPAVEHYVNLARDKTSVARNSGAMANDSGMALGRRGDVFRTVVNHLDGTLRLMRQQSRMRRDH